MVHGARAAATVAGETPLLTITMAMDLEEEEGGGLVSSALDVSVCERVKTKYKYNSTTRN